MYPVFGRFFADQRDFCKIHTLNFLAILFISANIGVPKRNKYTAAAFLFIKNFELSSGKVSRIEQICITF